MEMGPSNLLLRAVELASQQQGDGVRRRRLSADDGGIASEIVPKAASASACDTQSCWWRAGSPEAQSAPEVQPGAVPAERQARLGQLVGVIAVCVMCDLWQLSCTSLAFLTFLAEVLPSAVVVALYLSPGVRALCLCYGSGTGAATCDTRPRIRVSVLEAL